MEPFHFCRKHLRSLVARGGSVAVRGFTLVEMMVVLVIIGIISVIIITSQTKFNNSFTLSNTAYDIALALRSAQTFGLGSRVNNLSTMNTGYGITFSANTPSTFILFADTYPVVGSSGLCHNPPVVDPVGPNAQPGNCVFDANNGEQVTSYALGNGMSIDKLCAYNGSWTCSPSVTSLAIVFSRPNADPFISTNGSYSSSPAVTAACIAVKSPQGVHRYVSIVASGQITANATSCP